jgi:hypothetical protein
VKTSVIISSCDLYSDCWAPMIHSFRLHWPDCPFPIYFISNFSELDEPGITFIKVGEHKGFGSNMKKALELIGSDNVILFLEDFFLDKKIETEMIFNHIQHCKDENIDFLKIDSRDIIYRDDLRIGDSFYCSNPLDIKYSLNASIAIWKKEALLLLSVEGFSAWDFERKGLSYIRENQIKIKSETILSTSFNSKTIKKISAPGAVCKGMWTNEGVEFLTKYNYIELISTREIEGKFIRFLISLYRPNSLSWIPIGLLLRLLQKFKINL